MISMLAEDRPLGVGEFFVAAVVAAVVDEFLGGDEIVLGRFPRQKRRARWRWMLAMCSRV